MADMFDEMIWCKDCRTEMKRVLVNKEGFQLRALQCPKCGKRIFHPNDVEEFKKFSQLRQRPFEVKLRMVGNSYAVSIPREIIDFMQNIHEQENLHKKINDKMNEMVKLSLEESGRISLCFGKEVVKIEQRDSANPEKNKSITIEKTYTNENGRPKTDVKVTQEKQNLNKIKLKPKRANTQKK